MIKNIRLKKSFLIASPDNKLDYIYVEDIARYFIKILTYNPNSGIYNVGSGQRIKIKDIFKILKIKIDKNYNFNVFGNSRKILNFCSSQIKSIKSINWKPKFTIKTGLDKIIKLS